MTLHSLGDGGRHLILAQPHPLPPLKPRPEGLHILAVRMTDAQYIRMEGKSSSVLSRPMLLTPRSPARRWIVTFRLHRGTRLVDAHDERRMAPPDLRLVSAFLDSLSEDVFLPLWW